MNPSDLSPTVEPSVPVSGDESALSAWSDAPPIPSHIAAGDEGQFIAFAMEWRRRTMAGKEAHTDHQLVTAWLAQCSPTGSYESVKTYRRHIERFRSFLRQWNEASPLEQTGERLLAPGDPEAIEAFAAGLREQTQQLLPNGRARMAPATYNVLCASLASFYKWAAQPTRRHFTGIPLSPVPAGLQLRKQPRRAKALTTDQLQQLYFGASQVRTSPSRRRDELAIRLIYFLATRATESVNLRWADVVEHGGGPAVHIRRGKGDKERFIAIDAVVIDLMEQLKAAQPASEWMLPNMRNPERHISRQGLWRMVNRAGDEVGLRCFPHQMRHSHATHAYRRTKDPQLIQRTLGHADIGTTMDLYVHGDEGDSSTKHLTGES